MHVCTTWKPWEPIHAHLLVTWPVTVMLDWDLIPWHFFPICSEILLGDKFRSRIAKNLIVRQVQNCFRALSSIGFPRWKSTPYQDFATLRMSQATKSTLIASFRRPRHYTKIAAGACHSYIALVALMFFFPTNRLLDYMAIGDRHSSLTSMVKQRREALGTLFCLDARDRSYRVIDLTAKWLVERMLHTWLSLPNMEIVFPVALPCNLPPKVKMLSVQDEIGLVECTRTTVYWSNATIDVTCTLYNVEDIVR